MVERTFHFEQALLPDGWAADVRLSVDQGMIDAVQAGVAAGPGDERHRVALPGLPNRWVVPQFTPDDAYLFAITNAGRAYRWDVRPSSWARHACAVAGRSLNRTEWKDVLPERDYTPACTG